jgi:hypothetical protein
MQGQTDAKVIVANALNLQLNAIVVVISVFLAVINSSMATQASTMYDTF